MKAWFLIAATITLFAGAANAQSLVDARSAYRANRIAEAERILTAIAADPATAPAGRAAALRQSARIAWRIDGDFPRALEALRGAERADSDACGTATDLARLLREAGRARELLAQADTLSAKCPGPGKADGVLLEVTAAALDHAAENRAGREAALARAEALFAEMSEDAQAGPEGAPLHLELSLLRGNAPRALQAWRNYFWLVDADLPQGVRPRRGSAGELFGRGLAASASREEKLALIDLLIRAGFASTAERFAAAAEAAGEHPLWRRASAYFAARREIEADLLSANRAIARGGQPADLIGLYRRFTARLLDAAGESGDERTALREAYGLYGQVGLTGGFPSLHLGHVMQDESRTVEQYGHRADIRFVALDNMIANGFQSWLWDGLAAVGGWTEDGPIIVQVRPGYVSSPLALWRLFEGGPAKAELLERQPQRAATDIAALAARDTAPLPGLADRLQLQLADQIGARARAAAGAAGDLRRAFLDEAWRASFNQSMVVHEGRHAIDRRLVIGLARFDDANLEYRAMLSELALADYPRLGLYNMVAGGVGDGTAYGEANARIIRDLAAWIAANPSQVAGFDSALPAAVQLDRLTDEQMRAIARSLDPIAR